MRLLPWLGLVPLLVLASSGDEPRAMFGRGATMTATRVTVDPRDPAHVRVGALTFVGGVRLRGNQAAFGGFSSMTVEGDRFTLLSDGGTIVRFRMGADFVPRDVRFADLPGGPRTGAYKKERDSESMTGAGTPWRWVGFEDANEIWRFDAALTHAQRIGRPTAMRRWPVAGGAEAMVRLRDGRFVVFSESKEPPHLPDARVALLFAGDPTLPGRAPMPFVYVPPRDYEPTDAAELPDGRLVVLNRRFGFPDLFTARVTLIDLKGLRPGKVVRGQEIAALVPPLLHDNYEAIAVTQEAGGTMLWIASDDNQEGWEWSLLLKFRLDLPQRVKAGPDRR